MSSLSRKLKRKTCQKGFSTQLLKYKFEEKTAIVGVYLAKLEELIKKDSKIDGKIMSDLANAAVRDYVDIRLHEILGKNKANWKYAPIKNKKQASMVILASKLAGKELTKIFIQRRLAAAEKAKAEKDKEKEDAYKQTAKYQKDISKSLLPDSAKELANV